VGKQVTRFRIGDLPAPVYLPDWIEGPVTPRAGRRRLGGPTDGVLSEFKGVNEEEECDFLAIWRPWKPPRFPSRE
jgi:hypothetical protein